MDFIKVYEYLTEADALYDIEIINNFIGTPPSKNNNHRTYDLPFEKDGKWYFRWSDFTDDIIGKTYI